MRVDNILSILWLTALLALVKELRLFITHSQFHLPEVEISSSEIPSEYISIIFYNYPNYLEYEVDKTTFSYPYNLVYIYNTDRYEKALLTFKNPKSI